MNILFLCHKKNLGFGQASLARAFQRRGITVTCARDDCPLNEDIERILADSQHRPDLIIEPELDALLPWGLDKVDIPTACFHADPYAYLHLRVRWAMLFDYVFLFHPGFEEAFRQVGHSNPVTVPHAVDPEFFTSAAKDRPLDIGWVGRSDGPRYQTRRRVLERLATMFRMNEWKRFHSQEELGQVFCASKLVVNVGRDDYPIDASLHFAEAMAADALFITLLPSEMTQLGFQEGIHYVGVQSEAEIPEVVRYYLDHEDERDRIAEAGREKVLREHTYDNRASFYLTQLEQRAGRLFAPARQWTEGRVRTQYIDYYAANRVFDCAYAQWRHLATSDLPHALAGGMLIGRAWLAELRRKAVSPSRHGGIVARRA
jgi:spore maturation protein CgeB